MNEMYNMGLSLHSIETVALLVMIFLNLFFLISKKEIKEYKRLMSVFLQPLTLTTLGLVIFTGVIMMAGKHLSFTIENIVMIIASLAFILLEFKRIQSLKHMNENKERVFEAYKPFARRILQIEFMMVLTLGFWMWFI